MIDRTDKKREEDARACDTCPFADECSAYREAFGRDECYRDDWAKSLFDCLSDKDFTEDGRKGGINEHQH